MNSAVRTAQSDGSSGHTECAARDLQVFEKIDIARAAAALNDAQLVAKLPAFFRTVRGADLGEKELESLIRKIKEAHTTDEHQG